MNTALKNPWLGFRSRVDRLDALYFFGHKATGWCAQLKQIPTLYDAIYEDYPECYPEGVPARMRAEVSQAVSRATVMVVISEATADSLRKHYGWTGPTINTGAAARPLFALPKHEQIESRIPYFLYVGRMDARKNVVRIVDAYRGLISEGQTAELVLVGPDDAGSRRLAEVLSSGEVAGERIRRTGYLEEPQLLELYQGAVAFVYPSLAEGFGMPILEAMACGTPVITSNCSALLEVAGSSARLVSPTSTDEIQSAMRELLTQPDRRKSYREAGLARAADYTWSKCAAVLWDGLARALR